MTLSTKTKERRMTEDMAIMETALATLARLEVGSKAPEEAVWALKAKWRREAAAKAGITADEKTGWSV